MDLTSQQKADLDELLAADERALLQIQSSLDAVRETAGHLAETAERVRQDPAAVWAEMGDEEFLALVKRLAALVVAIGYEYKLLALKGLLEWTREGNDPADYLNPG